MLKIKHSFMFIKEEKVMFKPADITQTLQAIPWFLDLKPYQLERLSKVANFQKAGACEELFHEGAREDDLYILLEGQVNIWVHVPSRGSVCVFTAEPLDILGWSTLTPVVRQRTATAKTTCPSTLLCFDGELLRHLCDEDHDIGYLIMRRVSNVVASRLLTTRLQLFDIIVDKSRFPTQLE
jgi:CRP/FNR family transcriptional regulator, cyclic AMP receptor protein